ncbi:MAG TPA: hypothetical protein ENK43_15040 [Planctomycetes bacterium]|nr:hypothetical protein [Planctomycetota bacterium]
MRHLPFLILVATMFLLPAQAQTTGIPGFNDYTIAGAGSGSTSCTALTFTSPVVLNFQVSASGPGLPVFAVVSNLPCSPGAFSPFTCQGTTFDLVFTPGIIVTPLGVTGPGGVVSVPVAVPPLITPITFATQCVVVDPGCAGLPLFTQAYDVFIL